MLSDQTLEIPNHEMALDLLLTQIKTLVPGDLLHAVGHRVVHGGSDCDCPLAVTPVLEASLRKLIPLAPQHQPHNLAGITAVRRNFPGLLQVASFDTAFHHKLPRLARLTGLPLRFEEEGIRRYGFHGLSYEYIMSELHRRHGQSVCKERIIVAHLGNGASMAAIKNGQSVDTTMGFSALGGLSMGTRSGDLDPGILLYLLSDLDMTPEQVKNVLYQQSGLLGVSGISRNMRVLLEQSATKTTAAEAIEFFCYQARKHLAALTASLGGIDRLVFTGGIGANAPKVRAQILNNLSYLGLDLDHDRNDKNEKTISSDKSAVAIEAFATNEQLMIARHVMQVLTSKPGHTTSSSCETAAMSQS